MWKLFELFKIRYYIILVNIVRIHCGDTGENQEVVNLDSHANLGWEGFTDEVIRAVNLHSSPGVVFLLWGNPAQRKRVLIDETCHHVLCCAHPSPLSAYRGFFGSNIFKKTNELLAQSKRDIIKWDSVLYS